MEYQSDLFLHNVMYSCVHQRMRMSYVNNSSFIYECNKLFNQYVRTMESVITIHTHVVFWINVFFSHLILCKETQTQNLPTQLYWIFLVYSFIIIKYSIFYFLLFSFLITILTKHANQTQTFFSIWKNVHLNQLNKPARKSKYFLYFINILWIFVHKRAKTFL